MNAARFSATGLALAARTSARTDRTAEVEGIAGVREGEYQRKSGDRARTGRKEKRRDVGAPGSKTDVCGLQEQQPEETPRAECHFIGQWQPVAVQFSDSLSAQARSVRLPHADNSNHLTLMYNAVLGILVCISHPCHLARLLSGKNRPSQRSVSRNLFRSSFCFY